MRFVAPARAGLDPGCFDHPVFADLCAFRDLLLAPDWPSVEELELRLGPMAHQLTGMRLRLARQEALSDETNYELRIFQNALIATRSGNWHDLLNALVWKRYPAIKSSLNAIQVADMQRLGARVRSRRQYACTQFDEAGAVVVVRDRAVLESWDRHDWQALFLDRRAAWSDGSIQIAVFGHALFEHALDPAMLLVSKTMVILDEGSASGAIEVDDVVALAIAERRALDDPQDLRPLPLAGIPGWSRERQDAAYYRDTPCFRPIRPGRLYPLPLRLRDDPAPA